MYPLSLPRESIRASRTIFFSWQSDVPGQTTYIREHVQSVINELNKARSDNISYSLDEATRDESGAPNIATTILDKIETCQVFIADLSIIDKGQAKNNKAARKYPNSNVVFETGFAMQALGCNRVILLCNQGTNPDDLPFDLRQNRITKFTYPDDQCGLKIIKEVVKKLENLQTQVSPDLGRKVGELLNEASNLQNEIRGTNIEPFQEELKTYIQMAENSIYSKISDAERFYLSDILALACMMLLWYSNKELNGEQGVRFRQRVNDIVKLLGGTSNINITDSATFWSSLSENLNLYTYRDLVSCIAILQGASESSASPNTDVLRKKLECHFGLPKEKEPSLEVMKAYMVELLEKRIAAMPEVVLIVKDEDESSNRLTTFQ
jgi:hypothetical protein